MGALDLKSINVDGDTAASSAPSTTESPKTESPEGLQSQDQDQDRGREAAPPAIPTIVRLLGTIDLTRAPPRAGRGQANQSTNKKKCARSGGGDGGDGGGGGGGDGRHGGDGGDGGDGGGDGGAAVLERGDAKIASGTNRTILEPFSFESDFHMSLSQTPFESTWFLSLDLSPEMSHLLDKVRRQPVFVFTC